MRKTFDKFIVGLTIIVLFIAQTSTIYALEFTITGNGSGSDSQVDVSQETQTTVTQTNQADVANGVSSNANTGDNSASGNTGGDTVITTGDVDSSVQVQNSANTSSVDVGCCPEDTQVTISGNGSNSQNNVNLSLDSNTNIVVNQTANIANNVNGSANSGGNSADNNTGGSVTIQTGKIKASGGIKNAPLNISSISSTPGVGGVSVDVSGNGADSENSATLKLQSNTNVFSNYEANLENYVIWDLNTGKNSASGNTGGDVTITTGDIDLSLIIENNANFGHIDIDCCPLDGERPPVGDGEKPPTEEEKPPSDGEKKEEAKVGDGGALPGGAEAQAGGPGILGLAVTSGGAARTLFLIIGLAMLVFGSKVLNDDAHPKKNRQTHYSHL